MSRKVVSNKMKEPVDLRRLGGIYIFIAILILIVGYIAHLTNTLLVNPNLTYETLLSRIDLYFFEYVMIGFFTGLFVMLGLVYLRKKPEKE